ncbi:poly-gamma-glutamate biosynthesis protein PgsC [Paraclostridium ghonii]|uniref:poly-gamma-glutamate biosynthesis protein PgsC n=1 Tax=Paraclostridium ghonii TaxID=29358 RepID=UPI00202CCC64|nr:poly-gamma-glutamate biosynthesis protein PgsC [Paeniclostridium ghonii]MCM0165838.1 poly-gamma-glutamate biosynthesis protein PgsC [Paeniclostridium ghonii]
MIINELYIVIILGLTLSLLFSEKFGINPGGLIVPGYIALSMNNIKSILLILIMSMTIYIIVNFGISKIMIIYGRRRFLASIIVGLCLKIIIDFTLPELSMGINALKGVGIVVPALIAHTFYKQGIKLTTVSTLGLSSVIYGIVNILNFA